MPPEPRDAPPSAEERLDRLERLIEQLVRTTAREESAAAGAAPGASAPGGTTPRAATPDRATPGSTPPDAVTPDTDPFWALTALKERVPPPGAVVYAGAVDLGVGHVEYQWGRPTDPLLRADWADRAERIAALGHPLRLSLLRLLLDGERTVAQLVDELDLASTGIAYHHLNQLQGAGWVTSPRRGVWEVPLARVVPLLAVMTALEGP